MAYHQVTVESLNIRKTPSANPDSKIIGKLAQGDIVESDFTSGTWLHITRYFRDDMEMAAPDPENSWCEGSFTVLADPPDAKRPDEANGDGPPAHTLSQTLMSEAVQYYRKPHDIEMIGPYDEPSANWQYGGDGYRNGKTRQVVIKTKKPLPEVYRCKFPDHPTLLSDEWVQLWRDLNPQLSVEKFCTLLDNHLAWTNGTGWPRRRNCLTNDNMNEKPPAFHAVIINGGAILKGVEQDGELLIETMLASDPVPTAELVLAKPWLWYWGTSVTSSGQVNLMMRKSTTGEMVPVRVPLITRVPIRFPLHYLHKLPVGFLPPDARWLPS